ncbi:MAG: FkbM family methyltransferase [Longimicrobiaceae bacterium]
MLYLVREVRDHAFAPATAWKRTVEIEGVRLALDGVSPRMRYVMCAGYERAVALLARALLTRDDSILEAGAAIGFIAAYCMKVIGIRDYTAVEANPALLEAIRRNAALNGIAPPRIVHAAVCAADGEVSFGVNRNFWSSSTFPRPGSTSICVHGRSLPSLLAEMASRPTALIMDIEGSEAALPAEHFASFDKLIVEVHPGLAGKPAIALLLAGLREQGFHLVDRAGGSYAFAK